MQNTTLLKFSFTICVLLAWLAAVPAAFSQTTNELSAYTFAVAHVEATERLQRLEQFSIHARPGPLKSAALEMVIWEYLRSGNVRHALTWANELAASDKNNAVAIALLSDDAKAAVQKGSMKPERLLSMSHHGLDTLPQLQRPLGMNGADFALEQRQAYAMLSSAAGFAELRMKDYTSARVYMHNALAVQPGNAQDDYTLALADLNGNNPNTREGYWYLARAVDLTRGTPEGAEIARFARARYVKDGGSTADWDRFLASAGTPAANGPSTAAAASATPPPLPAPPSKTVQPVETASVHPPTVSKPGNSPSGTKLGKSPSTPSVWADDTTSNPPVRKRQIPAATGPMSLGILVETSLANKQNRAAVVNSLTDMVRRLNDRDEAFILTYDNNIVFEQDLTSDPQQLEQAMESIKPQKGAVLDDAIAFAAGHLARIAKYPNRVLLVISDGRNVDSHASPLQTSAEINAAGVRIYCIGVDVSDAEGQYRLQTLAASTGGRSNFISTPGQFRNATRDIAKNMGIDFRF